MDLPTTPHGSHLYSGVFGPSSSFGRIDHQQQQQQQQLGGLINIAPRNRRGDLASRIGSITSSDIGLDALQLPSSSTGIAALHNRTTLIGTQDSSINNNSNNNNENNNGEENENGGGGEDSAGKRVIWGTTVDIHESIQMFEDFLKGFNMGHRAKYDGVPAEDITMDELNSVPFYIDLITDMRNKEEYCMNLDCVNLLAYPVSGPRLYQQLVNYPSEMVSLMDDILTHMFISLFPEVNLNGNALRVRPFNLAASVNMRSLNPSDIDKLVSIKGMLIRASPVIPDLKSAFFRCNVCDSNETVAVDRGYVDEPAKCNNNQCRATRSMILIHNRCEYADKQVCRLQETPDMIPDGQTPHAVSLHMFDELVDFAKPGDRLEITGIYRGIPVRANPRMRTVKAIYRTYLDVVHIRKTDKKRLGSDNSTVADNEFEVKVNESDSLSNSASMSEDEIHALSQDGQLFDILSQSLAPSIFGLEDVKKGILLQLLGGSNKNLDRTAAPRIRGDINILLVGDPGVSKSQLLSYAHKIAPRGVYTSGKGSSAVGLTAYVTRDPDTRQVVLESGALVMSDGGVCCIDEFDKMSDSTRSILHEVMEQQTVSVAKAGIIATLNARTSILASANPIDSRWDRTKTIVDNINLPPTLLSRFDLVFILLDLVNERDDRRLARHLVSLYLENRPGLPSFANTAAGVRIISKEKLTQYITYAKREVNPVLGEDAADELVREYVELRGIGRKDSQGLAIAKRERNKRITATVRQLESMVRLSEAHARMRLSPIVEASDVLEAARLLKEAIRQSATNEKGVIDIDHLVTGISASSRKVLTEMMDGILSMLRDKEHNPTGSLAWSDAFAKFENMVSVPVSKQDFDKALNGLQQQGTVAVAGNRNKTIKLMEAEILS
ncbi:MCM-domain-containing protein [Ramicandelaber brevisporus]|nr:MCM-domain-containing protein [Ramicandelaber brevisporus]